MNVTHVINVLSAVVGIGHLIQVLRWEVGGRWQVLSWREIMNEDA